jgi:hypothetical protein
MTMPGENVRQLPLRPGPAAAVAALALLLLWSPALFTPYWQDDYFYLYGAQQARLAGESWLAPFSPAVKTNFWRPLGMESYWRLVEGVLGGEVMAAHALNLALLLLAAAAVGWLAATLVGRLAPGGDPRAAGVLAGFLYGAHASHFLPVAWAAAANDSIAVIFAALALRFWLVTVTAPAGEGRWAALLTVASLALALLSRDGAIVLPALGLLLALWLRPRYRPSPAVWLTGAACLAVALGWLLLRAHFTLPPHPAYQPQLGLNVLRNSGALLLFWFNVPFEALRFFFYVTPSGWFVAWGAVCLALQAAACTLLLRGCRGCLGRKELGLLLAFAVIGCAPYYLLSLNCYPYYLSLGLIAYALLGGLAELPRRQWATVVALTLLSSLLAVLGNYALDSPSHIGRARWAERQLAALELQHAAHPQRFAAPLVVVVEDEHRYLGFRAEGIAYRLGLPLAGIVVTEPGDPVTALQPVLVVPAAGDVYFREPVR